MITPQEWIEQHLTEATMELARLNDTPNGRQMILALQDVLDLLEAEKKLKLFAGEDPSYAKGVVAGIKAVAACVSAIRGEQHS